MGSAGTVRDSVEVASGSAQTAKVSNTVVTTQVIGSQHS